MSILTTDIRQFPQTTADFTVRRIRLDDAMCGPPVIQQLASGVSHAGVCLDLFFGAYDPADRLRGAAVMVIQPGRTGLIFPARPRRRRDIPALAMAARACCAAAQPDQVHIAQAILGENEQLEAQAMQDAGFWRLSRLAYMRSRITAEPQQPSDNAINVTYHAWDDALSDDFIEVMRSSYRHTLDCPKIQGLRDIHDVLMGHRGTGDFDPSFWTLARIDGRPAGVILLNRIPPAACVELVYLGVAENFRRRNLAHRLLQHAFGQCAWRNETHVTLAVDVDNVWAISLYRKFGFYRTDNKQVLIKSLLRE